MSEELTSLTKSETDDLDHALNQLFDDMIDNMIAAGVGITATLNAIKAVGRSDFPETKD